MTNAEQQHPIDNYEPDVMEAQASASDLALNDSSLEFEFNQGLNAYAIGDYKEAKVIFSKLAKVQPDQSVIFLNLGNACYQLKQEEEAIAYWQKSVDLDPMEATAYLNIGNIYFSMKNYQQAAHYWEQFTTLNRNNANAWLNLGIAYDHLKRPVDALDAYALFLGLKQGSAEAIKLQNRFAESKKVYEHNTAVAEELLEKGQGVKALNIFLKAMERYPGSARHYKMVAGLLYKMGDLEQAERHYEFSLKQKPEDPTALTNLGVAYEKMHRPVDALWAYTQAIQHAQKDHDPLKKRAQGILKQGSSSFKSYLDETISLHKQFKAKKALKQINRLNALCPYIEKEHPDFAQEIKEWHQRIQEANNPSLKAAKSYYNQAIDAQTNGKFDQAIRLYNKYLSVDGKSERAGDVRKRLSEIQNTMGAAVQALLKSDRDNELFQQ